MSPILLYHWLGRSLLMGRYERRRPVPSSLHLLDHPRTVAIKQSIRKTGVIQGIKWPLRPGYVFLEISSTRFSDKLTRTRYHSFASHAPFSENKRDLSRGDMFSVSPLCAGSPEAGSSSLSTDVEKMVRDPQSVSCLACLLYQIQPGVCMLCGKRGKDLLASRRKGFESNRRSETSTR
jgi:hypothetical protein